jgi:alkyl hydroperoxide reductase subunit AhpC
VQFPIIADPDRKISYIYDMLDYQDATNRDLKGLPFTVRYCFLGSRLVSPANARPDPHRVCY